MQELGDPRALGGHLPEVIERGRAYREAGADCVFALGVHSVAEVRALVEGIGGWLNVLVRPGTAGIGGVRAGR